MSQALQMTSDEIGERAATVCVCLLLLAASVRNALGQTAMTDPAASAHTQCASLPTLSGELPYIISAASPLKGESPSTYDVQSAVATADQDSWVKAASATMILPSTLTPNLDGDEKRQEVPEADCPNGLMLAEPSDVWDWQALPQGLIYRSYWAGVKEPRLGIQLMHVAGERSFWDPTVGAGLGCFASAPPKDFILRDGSGM